jgi:ABC-type antimicrobial peptide transport system permease subunit
MSFWHLVGRSLVHHWRMNAAIALGVAAGTSILTGALLVGDSVRGSLMGLALDRLGRIDAVLARPMFFREALANKLVQEGMQGRGTLVVPIVLVEGTLEQPDSHRRATQITIIGSDEQFWMLDNRPVSDRALKAGEVILTEPLARELGIESPDKAAVAKQPAVIMRLPSPGEVPADSPLGRKTETVRNLRLNVVQVIPAEGLARFSLNPSQRMSLNAFVSTETLQRALEQPDRVNAIVVGASVEDADQSGTTSNPLDIKQLDAALHPQLEDYGLRIEQTPGGYFDLSSERMILEPEVVREARKSFAPWPTQVAFTYLANTIAANGREIPYSTITGIDPVAEPPLGPFVTETGAPLAPLGDDELALNSWAAEQLGAKVGDEVEVVYFKPESTHGRVEEDRHKFRLAHIVKLEGAAADRLLTPKLKGVTDQVSMADWNPPFPFDGKRIRSEDEAYWDDHGPTPKAFVSLAMSQKLWGSRFGDATSVRVAPPAGDDTVEKVAARLHLDPAELGLRFQPVRAMALAAATGTTPFNGLFLGFSFFLIAAAVMLVSLLFRLAVDGRAEQIGLLVALGWSMRQVRRLWAAEGLAIALVGGIAGVLLGIGYAALMIVGLRTWWVAAITSPFVDLHFTPTSLVVGYASGVIVAWLAIVLSLRRLGKRDARALLAGKVEAVEVAGHGVRRPWARIAGIAALVGGAALAAAALSLSGEAQAGAFFGSGALVLVGLLTLLWSRLRSGETGPLVTGGGGGALARLALRNAARHPGRSVLTIGLVAAASFLIVAISAFRMDAPDDPTVRESGTGGFALVAESDQPIYQDLAAPETLNLTPAEVATMADATIFPVRVRQGDDASCLNLYQPQQPRVLGLPRELLDRGGFQWGATLAETEAEQANPWLLLERDWGRAEDGAPLVPVVLDAATAMYSLHLAGAGARYELPRWDSGAAATDATSSASAAPKVHCLVVGLLKNSILQGDILMSERALTAQFPDVSGYEFFLIDCPTARQVAIESALEKSLGDYGFDVQASRDRLAMFLVVQNTYLSTFQSLGGLGLLLGTLGLVVVELRNVLERRGELALLRAVGFRTGTLAWLVLTENAVLLVGGLAIGLISALVAVAPHLVDRSAAIPWLSLAGTLSLVLFVGLSAGWLAVRASLAAPLLPALRGE